MKIKMHVKEGGLLAFVCDGVLKEPLEKIILNKQTRFVHFVFKDSGTDVELDCPVDEHSIAAVGDYSHCAIGFCEGDKILAATMVPLEQV